MKRSIKKELEKLDKKLTLTERKRKFWIYLTNLTKTRLDLWGLMIIPSKKLLWN